MVVPFCMMASFQLYERPSLSYLVPASAALASSTVFPAAIAAAYANGPSISSRDFTALANAPALKTSKSVDRLEN